jgi:hypothetical protein
MYVATPGDVRPAAYAGLVTGANYTGSGAWVFEDYPASSRIHALHSDGTLRFIAIAGTQAPGMPAGVAFKKFGETASSRSAENVVFRATLIGPSIDDTTPFSAFARVNGATRLLSRPGLPAPELGPDVVFDLFGTGAVNDMGQILLISGLAGPGVNTSNDAAMWYDTGDGVLHLLLREGDPFTFDGTTRTLRTFQAQLVSGGGTGADTFNNAGQFVCGLTFTDGSSGVFLFQIPEPSATAAALAVAVGTLALGKRRPRAGRPRHG